QVDQQLKDSRFQFVPNLGGEQFRGPHPPPGRGGPPGYSTYAVLALDDGTVIGPQGSSSGSNGARPALPTPLSDVPQDTPMTVDGTDGSQWRLLVEPLHSSPGEFVVLAIPLTVMNTTLTQVLVLEATIGVAVLALVVGLGLAIVRLGLRPLERM